jgi:glutathione S-transferase
MIPPMKLYYSPTSPFARKVRILVHELALDARVELVQTDPWRDPGLRARNPLAKVPTLLRDDGSVLYESGVICEFLAFLAGDDRFLPPPGEARWQTLRLQGLCDGACTAAGRLYADQQRSSTERSERMMDRLGLAIDATVDAFEQREPLQSPPRIGEVAAACLLSYLDFRWPSLDWRAGRPRLAAWLGEMERRPSLQRTRYALPASPSPPEATDRQAAP